MSSTYLHKDRSETILAVLKRELEGETANGHILRILECAVVERKTAYLAIESTAPNKTSEVYGLVCILYYAPKDRFNFGYKPITETQGPWDCKCPERILDMLTPTGDAEALNWRQRCRNYASAVKAIPILAPGTTVAFDPPLRFPRWGNIGLLVVCHTRPQRFYAKDDNGIKNTWPWPLFRIPKGVLSERFADGTARIVTE